MFDSITAIVIECRQLRGDEEAAIKHQVTLDLPNAIDTQVA